MTFLIIPFIGHKVHENRVYKKKKNQSCLQPHIQITHVYVINSPFNRWFLFL